ncbi:MAG: site-specific DNA-methyltransferase [Parcubacteria group bacterium]|nr:site-specific DNA-methyltransferase [Parcubacteria group bacterium]
MNKLKQALEKVLKQEEAFLDAETGELNYIKIKDSADKIDEKLIALLAGNKELKDKFFSKIKDVYVFNINDFKFFLDESKIDNSYTKYANKIGLSDGNELLKNRSEVVLDFPFKDCVLEGGQSTEEGTDTYFEYEEEKTKTVKGKKVTEPAGYKEKQAKRKEVFFNQILAHDEIDRLFDRKALVNWKRFTKDSKKDGEAVKEIKRDKTGLIQENLIIKGNNLLALHSLKTEFAGKIKLIYIDPPYYFNGVKADDAFAYNSNFKLSTWLTFMKNRLDVAKQLLRDDGLIVIQISDDGYPYLKIMMDDKGMFGVGNYNSTISVKVSSESGVKVNANKPVRVKEYLLMYTKTENFIYKKQFVLSDGFDSNYSYFVKNREDAPEKWKIINIKEAFKDIEKKEINPENLYKFQIKYKSQIFSVRDISNKLKEKFGDNPNQFFVIEKEEKTTILWKKGEVVFFENKVNVVDGVESGTKYLSDIWNDISWDGIAGEGGVTLKGGKKPEKLLHRLLDMSTEEGDIVLDYHLGSGTTCAVAHKMKRQYIGIEQLDYVENDSVVRLKNVINGDNSGISKVVNWKGGGDFIYCELAKWNEKAKEEIQNAKDLPALVKLFDTLYERYFLNYNVKIKDFKDKIIKEDNFKKLSLDEQKRMFLTMLDLNQMYVQESEMADKRFGISKEDQKLTKEFYKN